MGSAISSGPAGYDERLTLPLWWWVAGLPTATLLAAEAHLGYDGVRSWLPYAVALPLAAAVLWHVGRVRVQLRDGELHVDDAHIPLDDLGEVVAVDAAAKRRLLGRDGDPAAFVVHRPWIPGALVARVTDPRDSTPYWLVSTRQPELLAARIREARATTHSPEPHTATE